MRIAYLFDLNTMSTFSKWQGQHYRPLQPNKWIIQHFPCTYRWAIDFIIQPTTSPQSNPIFQDKTGTGRLFPCMHVQPHTSNIPTIRQKMPIQLLDGPHSLPHLQTYRKIYCHKHGPHSSPTKKIKTTNKIESTIPLSETLDISPS